MRNTEALKSSRQGRVNGFIPSSFRAISSYLKIVSSGASTVARSAASVASSIVDRDEDSTPDQVLWAGFDKLEVEGQSRRVLLLGYRSGFQVWDVEEADNVRDLVSEHEGGAVSFMQMLPIPLMSTNEKDCFFESRPLLVVCFDSSGGNSFTINHSNGQIPNIHSHENDGSSPSVVKFYSLRSESYVHVMKFRSVVYSVRCSSRVVAISQAAQIQCLDTSTLEKSYTIVTNPIASGSLGSGLDIGYGPLAVGPRWLAYSGVPFMDPKIELVLPKQFTPSGLASNGSLVAHYAKESSKHIAAGIVTLGDMGYKKFSSYCSELNNGSTNGHHVQNEDKVGIVIVRDIVSKSVVAQFRAHKSPISALCFDPSGTLLVTASNQGHNINVFKIMPGNSGMNSHVHLFQLQRGLTNAVIRDISISDDGRRIMISSSRGTSHLFAINPQLTKFHISNQPVSLSPISRIRNGHSGWRGTVTGAAAAATGRFNFLSGAIASVFHNSKADSFSSDKDAKFHLLVFAPSGHLVQYALANPNGEITNSSYDSSSESLLVEAVKRWNVCQKQYHKEREFSFGIYTENGNLDMKKIYPEAMNKQKSESNRVKDRVVGSGDKHRCYMSEAELQMHQQFIPIWAKPRIYFQSMSSAEEDDLGGETQIEKIPTHTIETRVLKILSKNGRIEDLNKKYELVEESKPLSADGRGSNSVSAAELMDVNNNYSADEDQFQFDDDDTVNNRATSKTESPLKTVNTNQESLRTENHFEGKDDEFG